MKTPLVTLAVLLFALPAFAMSPELKNEDAKSYEYELTCGSFTTHTSIGSHSNTTLSQNAGCTLKVIGAGTAKLADNMTCRIHNGTLSCS